MKRTKKRRITSRSDTAPVKNVPRACIVGTLSAILIGAATIALMSLLLLCFDRPHVYILPLGLFCVYFSAFVGGVICALVDRENALFCGAVSGAAVFLILWAVFSLLDPLLSVESAGPVSLLLKAAVIPIHTLGALFGAKKPAQKRGRPKNF